MKLFFTIGLLMLSLAGVAQNKTVFYFKFNGAKVPVADSADYVRVVTPPDSASTLFNVLEYYVNGKRKLLGKSSTIDPLTLDGQCATFYTNGNRESVTEYNNGNYLGNSYMYYPNGKLHAILSYDTLSTKNYDVSYKIISCADSAGNPTVTDGNGRFIDYNMFTKTVAEEGNVKNGSPDGDWHGNYPEEKITYTDTYRNGQFISGYCVLPGGIKYTYTHRVQPPQFKGGDAAFIAYLKKKTHYQPAPAKSAAKKKTALIVFNINRQGKPVAPRLFGSFNPVLDKALINAAATSTGWTPAIQNGRPVPAPYNLALTL